MHRERCAISKQNSDRQNSKLDSQITPRAAVSIAVFRDGKVLLAQRGKAPLEGVWSLPGGRVESGEKARDAALRELAEETGVKASLLGVADVVDVILRDNGGALKSHYVITSFFGLWESGEGQAASDCMGVDWVYPSDVSNRTMTEGTPQVIRRAAALLEAMHQSGLSIGDVHGPVISR